MTRLPGVLFPYLTPQLLFYSEKTRKYLRLRGQRISFSTVFVSTSKFYHTQASTTLIVLSRTKSLKMFLYFH